MLASVLSTVIEDRARQQAEDAALMAVRLGLQPQFTPGRPRRRVPRLAADRRGGGRRRRLRAVRDGGTALAAFDPVELKVFGPDRTILYHSESPELVGETSQSGELGAALDGYVVSGFAHSADDGAGSEDGEHQLLEVYVPLQYDGATRPTAPSSCTCRMRRWLPPCATTSAP